MLKQRCSNSQCYDPEFLVSHWWGACFRHDVVCISEQTLRLSGKNLQVSGDLGDLQGRPFPKCQRPSSSALCVVRTVMSVVPLCVCVQICGSLSLQTLVQNVPRCDVMCCDVQCCAVLCCVVFRRAVCNQIVILRFVETHRRPPADVQMQLDELPKASRDLLCSLCFPGGKARRHNGTKA